MSASLLKTLADEMSALLAPVVEAVDSPLRSQGLLHTLGITPEGPASGDALLAAMSAIADLQYQLEAVAANSPDSFAGIAAVLQAAAEAVKAAGTGHRYRDRSFAGGLGVDLRKLLTAVYLGYSRPLCLSARRVAHTHSNGRRDGANPPRRAGGHSCGCQCN